VSAILENQEHLIVATACPHCAAPAAFASERFGPAGRMIRCARCGTAWPAGFHAEEQGEDAVSRPIPAREPFRPRFGTIVEHVPADAAGKAPRSGRGGSWRRFSIGRRIVVASSAAVAICIALVAMVIFNASLVGAAPEGGMDEYAGLEIRLLRSAIEPARRGHALAVEGQITNQTDGEMPVPAVRVSLRSQGREIHSWLVEPTTKRLAAGDSVLFRSVRASPPGDASEVAFRLAERQGNIIGSR
jgi:predicted Zn finger-like uncharacterized protein